MYDHVMIEVFQKPWAILPEKWSQIAGLLKLRASGQVLTRDEIESRLAMMSAKRKGTASAQFGAVGVIPVHGVISQRMNLMTDISGGTSTEMLTAQFREMLADSSVKAICLDVDSPGGGVEGVPELAAEIQAARGQKKIVSCANTMAASAAYWIAASADELCVSPSGSVGSIGVFAAHEDWSKALEMEGVKVSMVSAGKYKTEGNPYEPLSDAARADLQGQVESFYSMFVKSVASGRGVAQASVRGGFGEGRMVLAADAVREGMADRVATLDEVISELTGRGKKSSSGSSSSSAAETFWQPWPLPPDAALIAARDAALAVLRRHEEVDTV